MEVVILKNFIRMNVEILVAGVWIEGQLAAIEKGVVTLLPIGQAKDFYGPTALKVEVVQAIRQVKHQIATANTFQNPPSLEPVRSAFESTLPGNRAKIVND